MKKSGTENPRRNTSLDPIFRNSRGAALITIIIAIVVISAIGAAILSLSAVGTFNPILGNSADRAYYLAESGYRYAALKFQQGGESMLDELNGQSYPPGENEDNQKFTLQFRTHKLEVTGGGGSGTLSTEVPFGSVPQIPTGNVNGYLKPENANNEREFDYVDIPDPDGTQIDFDRVNGNWKASPGEKAQFAALSDGSTVSEEGGDLQLQNGTQALEFFPKYNGRFAADEKIYHYKIRDEDNNQLLGVTRVDGVWEAPSLTPNEAILLNEFVTVQSTGSYGQGFFGATRRLTFHVPFSEATGGGHFHDSFDNNKDHWIEENDETSAEGAHEVPDQPPDGDNALAVTDTSRLDGTLLDSSLIEFDWTTTNLDFAGEWESADNCLSYDTQVKILADSEPIFMNGISFRLDENLNSLGVSYLKAAPDNADGIPDNLVPEPGQTMVLLWERNDEPENWENWTWLAYHVLPEGSYIGPKIYFQDNMEDIQESESKWDNYEGEWEITDTDSYSGSQCWNNSPSFSGCETDEYNRLASDEFDLSEASNPTLSFWHHYSITGGTDGGIQISTDGGSNWEDLEDYNGTQNSWTKETIDLSDYAGEEQVIIRFILEIGNQTPDWYLDDVKVYEEEGLNWPTLLVSVKEAESISFNNGSNPINNGDIVYQEDEGDVIASATVYTDPVIEQGSWGGGNAEGDILLRDISGSFQTDDDVEDLLVNGEVCATITSLNNKQNYIRAYIGDQQEHGTPGTDPLDRQRLANPRGEVNWPPRDVDDTYAGNDYFTLVEWDEINGDLDPTSIAQMGAENEEDAVIRTDRITATSPDADFNETRPELGLHTWGWGSTDGEPDSDEVPNIYFDDFALRLDGVTATGGFAPAIQQSVAGE